MKKCDILIKNAKVLKPDMTVASGQFIAISDSRIIETGECTRREKNSINEGCADSANGAGFEEYTADTVINDSHILWMPGLTDGHLHTSQQFLKGSLLDEKPVIWKRINVPFEASLTGETMALSAQLAGTEMIKNGTTSFVDAGGPHVEAAAEEYLKMGMRGALTW